jgi:hypothetical protein
MLPKSELSFDSWIFVDQSFYVHEKEREIRKGGGFPNYREEMAHCP